jgi:hypothetical protein
LEASNDGPGTENVGTAVAPSTIFWRLAICAEDIYEPLPPPDPLEPLDEPHAATVSVSAAAIMVQLIHRRRLYAAVLIGNLSPRSGSRTSEDGYPRR